MKFSSAFQERSQRFFAIAIATLAFCWPALWNRYVLLFPDSITYLAGGAGTWAKLLHHNPPWFAYWNERSEVFTASLYLLHRGAFLLTIAWFFGLLLAWTVWLLVRVLFAQRRIRLYLLIVALVAAATGIAWYVSVPLADCLGPVLYLSVFLLVFGWEELRRWERIVLALLIAWTAATHGSHLLIGFGLCFFLALVCVSFRSEMRSCRRGVTVSSAMLLAAVCLQLGIHHMLYGKATLFGKAPPFLVARLVADGPARDYLQANCNHLGWVLCKHVDSLPTKEETFLWAPGSVWRSSTEEEHEELRREQTPLAVATLRAYPARQLKISAANFWDALTQFGPTDFGDSPVYRSPILEAAVPGMSARYERSRQAHDALPRFAARHVDRAMCLLSVLVVLGMLPWMWKVHDTRLLGLAGITVYVLLANAFVTGVLSGSFPRYQDRVAWMSTLLACVLLASWQRRRQGEA